MRERHRREIGILLGKRLKIAKVQFKVSLNGKQAAVVKYLRGRAMRLRSRYKGEMYHARVRKDGTVLFKGGIYPSLSAAGKAICGYAVNGWQFWQCERAPGDWVRLEKLRR